MDGCWCVFPVPNISWSRYESHESVILIDFWLTFLSVKFGGIILLFLVPRFFVQIEDLQDGRKNNDGEWWYLYDFYWAKILDWKINLIMCVHISWHDVIWIFAILIKFNIFIAHVIFLVESFLLGSQFCINMSFHWLRFAPRSPCPNWYEYCKNLGHIIPPGLLAPFVIHVPWNISTIIYVNYAFHFFMFLFGLVSRNGLVKVRYSPGT